jgi:FtsP/CotA-like multicopper oxidase with cupredoxin domain
MSYARVATIGSALLALAVFGSGVEPGIQSFALAQDSKTRQFDVAIKQRKVTSPTNVISVRKGDLVEIMLTADEAAELHLHGYDLQLSLSPDVPGKLRFAANIAGRFPLEAHRFGNGAQSGKSHGQRPLLYVEVQPR